MVDFRKGVSVHGGGAEGDIVTLDANKEIQTSGIKLADVAKKNDVPEAAVRAISGWGSVVQESFLPAP